MAVFSEKRAEIGVLDGFAASLRLAQVILTVIYIDDGQYKGRFICLLWLLGLGLGRSSTGL